MCWFLYREKMYYTYQEAEEKFGQLIFQLEIKV